MTHKFNAKKTTVDGHIFPSKAEARRYQELKLLLQAGEITNLELQPKFEILKGYKCPTTGRKVQPTYYIADFRVTYKDGRVEVEDVKSNGTITPLYRLKKKMFESSFNVPIVEVMR